MSLFGENRFKNLTAEYVEEKLALEAKDVSVNDDAPTPEAVEEAKDVSVNDDFDIESVDEASYIDALLEALDD